MLNNQLSIFLKSKKLSISLQVIKKMELVQKEEISLGLESYDALGFNSQEELELEISKLIKIRPEFEINRE